MRAYYLQISSCPEVTTTRIGPDCTLALSSEVLQALLKGLVRKYIKVRAVSVLEGIAKAIDTFLKTQIIFGSCS